VLDQVVDDYFPLVREMDQDIQEVETEVFSEEEAAPTQRIYQLRREVFDFHRATSPLVEPIRWLSQGRHSTIPEELCSYFRDVKDHLLRINDQVDGFREALASVLQANLAQVTVQQNEDTRRISAWVAIIAVPTAIAGIFGMNFKHMPELEWIYSYPVVLLAIACVCTALYLRFKSSGWL
jgi:magnesium transporter